MRDSACNANFRGRREREQASKERQSFDIFLGRRGVKESYFLCFALISPFGDRFFFARGGWGLLGATIVRL